jgi:hypothetical protein
MLNNTFIENPTKIQISNSIGWVMSLELGQQHLNEFCKMGRRLKTT